MVVIRRAEMTDGEDLFAWRNDSLTRNMSINSDEVVWEDHQKWLDASLNNSHRCLLIGEAAGEKIGVVRFDLEGNRALVSINLAPEARGKGLSKQLLSRAISHLAAQNEQTEILRAQIKPENSPSVKLFTSLGFELMLDDKKVNEYHLVLK